ncbi:Retrovirus-related Pol polyprotein from transposon 17.6 [Vitis vinifera]|uniref:Retrovirus-related Pol polyprotein from transposon 17.6 n=1 Tax=Vitis vinifera TaxID=29760 RepID=A0A438GA79_VITVI|nr:Retrovirus-related Pol polyprotein from transposon 17.6 [Vitis vinifera]
MDPANRKCLTSQAVRNSGCEISGEGETSTGHNSYPGGMSYVARHKGDRLRVQGVETPLPDDTERASLSGATPSGFPKRTCGVLPYPDSLREKHTTLPTFRPDTDGVSERPVRTSLPWIPKNSPQSQIALEKCHFMVQQGIVLSHINSEKGIEVDKAKVELIVKFPSPTTVKGVRHFLGHAGFYRRCQRSFKQLKQFLTTTPIVRSPNWQLPFEVMCDASDFAIGVVLGQREDGKPYVIYYASKTLNEVQRNYTTQRKNSRCKSKVVRWILLLQEFNLQIRDKKGVENVVADHLSRLAIAHNSHVLPINDDFLEESLMLLENTPWYAHIANYLVTGEVPSEWKTQDMKHFFAKIHAYYWEEPFLSKYCANQIIRKCVPEEKQQGILNHCHESACGGHFAS